MTTGIYWPTTRYPPFIGSFATNGKSWAYFSRSLGQGRGRNEDVYLSFMGAAEIDPIKSIKAAGWGAALAFGSGYYLSVNRGCNNQGSNAGSLQDGGRLFAYRYNDSTFTRIDSSMIYDAGSNVLSSPVLASGNNSFLLVYSEDVGPEEIRLKARLLSGGTALAVGNAFDVAPIPPDKRDQLAPVVGYDSLNGDYLVVWQQGRPFAARLETDIYGMWINGNGQPMDSAPFPICTASNSQEKPHLAYKDGNFLVTWNDLRNGSDWDVYGAIVTKDMTKSEALSDTRSLCALNAAYPNPFSGSSAISFSVPSKSSVSIRVYTLQGKLVRTLINGIVSSGVHRVKLFAGGDSPLPANVYLCRMKADGFEKTVRLLKLK